MSQYLTSLTQAQVPLVIVVLLRLAAGGLLLWQGYEKVQQGYLKKIEKETVQTFPLHLALQVWAEEKHTVYGAGDQEPREVRMFPWYRFFLEHAVLPNISLYAKLVTIGELALGGVLVLGILVPWVSGIGILLIVNYLIATWHLGFPFTVLNVLFIVALIVLALSRAGRCLGMDGWFHDAYPEIPIF